MGLPARLLRETQHSVSSPGHPSAKPTGPRPIGPHRQRASRNGTASSSRLAPRAFQRHPAHPRNFLSRARRREHCRRCTQTTRLASSRNSLPCSRRTPCCAKEGVEDFVLKGRGFSRAKLQFNIRGVILSGAASGPHRRQVACGVSAAKDLLLRALLPCDMTRSHLSCYPALHEARLSRHHSRASPPHACKSAPSVGSPSPSPSATSTVRSRTSRRQRIRLLPAQPLLVAGVLLLPSKRSRMRESPHLRPARPMAPEHQRQLSRKLLRCSRPSDPSAFSDIYPDQGLLQHEWSTHGTCSGLSANDFFSNGTHSLSLHYDSARAQYFLANLDAAGRNRSLFIRANPGLPSESVAISCGHNFLTAVEVCLDKSLHPIACGPIRSCRANTVRIPPPR